MYTKHLLVAISLLVTISCLGQADVEKARTAFDKDVKNPAILYGNNKQAGKYYSIRGFRMYAEVYGKGQPLLIIHGNGGEIRNFIYQVPYFSKKYKVIIADSRAHGKSVDPSDSLTYEMMADDYAALLDEMNIDSVNVIGWSDGGINALLLAIRHPKKVKKLAITGANLVPDTTAVPQSIWDMVTPDYQALLAKSNLTEQEKKSKKLLRLLVEQPHIPITDLQKITAPALVIGGDHDVIREEHTMLIYKNIPRAYLWIIPGSGHATPIMFKDDFNKTVDRFFTLPYKKMEGPARFM